MPNQSSLTQELRLHDARSFNTVQVAYVGIDHAEFGRVVAESQRLIGEADSRASHFEGVAQQVFREATAHIGYLTSLVEELRSQNELLQSGHTEKDVMITSLHEVVQEVKQTLENQIKFNQSMFEGQLRKAKDEIDRLSDFNQKPLNLLDHKDSEIQRLCQESSSGQDRISSLEARLAASSAAVIQSPAPAFVPKPVPDASSPKDTEGGNRMLESIMEAVQSLSSRMLTLESSRNSTDPNREPRPLFDRSRDTVVHSSSPPVGPSRGLRVGKGFPGGPPDPIDQGGDGSDDDEEELISESPSQASEREIVDSRALLHTKLEVVPQSAADFRAWKTNFFLMLGRLDISSNEYLSKWAATAFEVGQEKECQSSSGLIPRFDRWLAPELLKNARSSPELLFKVQGYVERCARQSTVPRGRMILYMIARHFDLDRTRGSLLTSQSIFQVELNGFSLKDLQEFSGTVMKTLNSIDPADWPNQRMLGEWFVSSVEECSKA